MAKERRTDKQVSTDELREGLNPQQCLTLGELELLGWSLKFVRRPMFQDPVPVVISDTNDEIGLLDPDGKIVIEKKDGVRSNNNEPGAESQAEVKAQPEAEAQPETETQPETKSKNTPEAEAVSESVVMASWSEKRRGEAPIPDNLEEYLNDAQVRALRQIENFGWQLKFVRRPMFQQPVAVIINTDGDRLGTLGSDGRIEMQSDFSLREDRIDETNEPATRPPANKKTG